MSRLLRGAGAGAALTSAHLLLLPEDLPAEVVLGLVRARHPDIARTGEDTWRLGRWTALAGPLVLDDDAATAAGVPVGWRCAWALDCPPDREDPPLPGTSDRDGLYRAFADGMPVRAERRGVELLLALARRLGGAVRVAGSGVVLQPDPAARVDRLVHSPYWLPPDQAAQVAAVAVPGARPAMDGVAWSGLGSGAVAALEDAAAGADLDPGARELLHRTADQRDAEVLAGPDVLDAYAVAVPVGPVRGVGDVEGVGGVVQLTVEGAVEPPPALAGLGWAREAVTYAVVWWPPDPAEAEAEHPSPSHRAMRSVAAAVVDALARAFADAVSGVVLDADGLPLH